MKNFVKLKIELTGETSYYLFNGTENYYKKLRCAHKAIENNEVNEYLYFGFFTLCAATLEYSLNFILADYCIEKFGIEKYKTYLDEFISLKFKNKLLMCPHIISDGKYVMNDDCSSFKLLAELINLRNRILHNKEFLNEFFLPLNLKEENGELIVPEGLNNVDIAFEVRQNPIDILNKSKCLAYGKALGDFKKYLMNPALKGHIRENKMIKSQ